MPIVTDGLKLYWNPKGVSSGSSVLQNIAPSGITANANILGGSVDGNGTLYLNKEIGSVTLPHNSVFNTFGSWTLEYIYQPTVLPAEGSYVLWIDDISVSSGVYGAIYRSAGWGDIYAGVYDSGGNFLETNPEVAEVKTLQQIHVMVVHDASLGTLSIFVNNSEKSVDNFSPVQWNNAPISTITLNKYESIAMNWKAFRFYDKALTPSERTTNFTNGDALGTTIPEVPTEPELVKIGEVRVANGDILPVYSIIDNDTEPLRIMTDEGLGFIHLTDTNDPLASKVRTQTSEGLRAWKK